MTKAKKGYSTLAEHDAEMKANGTWDAYVERGRRLDEERQKRWAARDAALVPLMEELHAAGCSISQTGHLTNQPNIPTAILILIAHLQQTTYPTDARMVMASKLNVPEVKAHWDVLLQLYRDEPQGEAKHRLAWAIAANSDDKVLDDVIALVRDKRHGEWRGLLLYRLEKTKDPRGRAVMEELADDPDLAKQIRISLRKLDKRAAKKKPPKQVTH